MRIEIIISRNIHDAIADLNDKWRWTNAFAFKSNSCYCVHFSTSIRGDHAIEWFHLWIWRVPWRFRRIFMHRMRAADVHVRHSILCRVRFLCVYFFISNGLIALFRASSIVTNCFHKHFTQLSSNVIRFRALFRSCMTKRFVTFIDFPRLSENSSIRVNKLWILFQLSAFSQPEKRKIEFVRFRSGRESFARATPTFGCCRWLCHCSGHRTGNKKTWKMKCWPRFEQIYWRWLAITREKPFPFFTSKSEMAVTILLRASVSHDKRVETTTNWSGPFPPFTVRVCAHPRGNLHAFRSQHSCHRVSVAIYYLSANGETRRRRWTKNMDSKWSQAPHRCDGYSLPAQIRLENWVCDAEVESVSARRWTTIYDVHAQTNAHRRMSEAVSARSEIDDTKLKLKCKLLRWDSSRQEAHKENFRWRGEKIWAKNRGWSFGKSKAENANFFPCSQFILPSTFDAVRGTRWGRWANR